MKALNKTLDLIDNLGLYPDVKTVASGPDVTVAIGDKEMSMFCTNNYLNLANHPEVVKASQKALEKYGTGAGGSRLISGTSVLHEELEASLANLKGQEDALVFTSGYLTNIGVISAIANPMAAVAREAPSGLLDDFREETVVFSDQLNHASIIDACKISKAQLVSYKHVDMADLEKNLIAHADKRKIIITDGVFSMDGNIAPLPEIVALAKKYDATSILDDAHATGILGNEGGGTTDYFGLKGQVDIEIGTLNKVFAGVGGFVAASKQICRFLRAAARPYIFSAALPPSVAAGLIAAIQISKEQPGLRLRLQENITLFQSLLDTTNINYLKTSTPIVPIIIGDEHKAIEVAHKLFEEGFFVPAVRWPAVQKGKARLRVTLMANHSKAELRRFADTLSKII